ncbi:conjugal transfer protein TraH [Vibrio coralliilyticus]|uniref:Conjugal transfer protein n=1 Tax=Vibrio coralliilyticus TaxID=190893 RepID=A0AAN0SIL4_9VIBR|nr:conjugal transfer protein TraH [Vibrio coralliilyticus]AIW22711.1 hypothetical protein IX92_27055 [Vibrio coralliilyticus]
MAIKRSLLSIAIGGTLLASSIAPQTASAASLSDMVEDLYGSFTSADTSSYTSASGRQVYSGGAVSIRFHQKDVNLINFQAPNVGIGCNGIDFFAGSIDLMSKDELVQVGRNIAAAATVYAFRLALNSVCASCNAIMTNIQNMVNQMNRLAEMSCEDALAVMENETKDFRKDMADTAANKWMKDVALSTTGDWADGLTKFTDNWRKNMDEEGVTKADIASKNPISLKEFTDKGYLIAYNTEASKVIFSWLPEADGRAALWSVLSENADCPDDANKESKGMMCGLLPKYRHRLIDFFMGDQKNADANSTKLGEYQMILPECKSSETITSTDTYTYKICKYTSNNVAHNLNDGSKYLPMVTTWMENVFGTNAYDKDKPTVIKTDALCDVNDNVEENSSLFSVLNTINTRTLSDTQAALIGILGTDYTRDLYKMDRNGMVTSKSAEIATCSMRVHLLEKHARASLATTIKGLNRAIDNAIEVVKDDTRWDDRASFESIKDYLCTLAVNESDVQDLLPGLTDVKAGKFVIAPPSSCASAVGGR